MKKIIVLLFILSFSAALAQRPRDMYANIELARINLKEKFNLPGRHVVKLLLKAYCEGRIKAYYPLNVNKECSYHEFVSHFAAGKTQPNPGADEFSNISCPPEFCTATDDDLALFMDHFDLFQVKRFDKNLSSELYDIKYIRIKYIKEKYDGVFDLYGPVFYYEDVIAIVGEEWKIPNPKNDAAKLSFKQYFESRNFIAVSAVDEMNANPNKPNFLDKKPDNREKDKWEH